MTTAPRIRWASSADYDALGDVMYDAVRNGPSRYTEAQRAAWTPMPRKGAEWAERLAEQEIIVAETSARIIGFMSLAPDGYIDFAYIRPGAQGSGLFRNLFNSIQEKARQQNEPRLWVHASLMARPAFSAMGFQIIKPENVDLGGQTFKRFKMEKYL